MLSFKYSIQRNIYHASCGLLSATLPLFLGSFGLGSFVGIGIAAASEAAPVYSMKQVVMDDTAAIFRFPQNFEPPGDERPENTRGSGSRTGACSTATVGSDAVMAETDGDERVERRIRAIAPPDHFGLTLQSHPRVFINFDGDVAQSVVMRVQDEAGEYDERVTLPVEPDRVIQGFDLPSDRPSLTVGKNYQWTILIACDGRVNPYHPIFSGWVQRVAVDAAVANLSQQSIEAQVEGHISGGYWYDAVAVLDEERQANPTDETIRLLWSQLMVLADGD